MRITVLIVLAAAAAGCSSDDRSRRTPAPAAPPIAAEPPPASPPSARTPPAPDEEIPQWIRDDMAARAAARRAAGQTPAETSRPVTAPRAAASGSADLATETLVRGSGPAPQPAASAAPACALVPVWDDARGPRPPAVRLCWGDNEMVINLYDAPGNTPQQIEFSLDGGPWIAARYGRVEVPDLGEGAYQVRCVAIPAGGRPWLMTPVELVRTARGWRVK